MAALWGTRRHIRAIIIPTIFVKARCFFVGKCLMCGKSGLFLRTDGAGLCKECALAATQRKEEEAKRLALAETQRKAEEIAATKEFIRRISDAFSDIKKSGGRIPISHCSSWTDTENVPYDSVNRLYDDCKLICDELPRWKEYTFFEEVFLSECEADPMTRAYYKHPFIDLGLIHEIDSPIKNNFDSLTSKLLERITTLETALLLYGKYEYKTCCVAGTTFKNDNGGSRQELLKKIRYRGAPYRTDPDIRLEKTLYDGEDAIAVYADANQIGWIPKSDLSSILPRFDRYKDVDQFSMNGGGSGGKKYGIDIRIRFYKKH